MCPTARTCRTRSPFPRRRRRRSCSPEETRDAAPLRRVCLSGGRGMKRSLLLLVTAVLPLAGCEYVKLLRPSVLKQLNPDVVRLVNELPNVDDPNEAIVARLFAHGGLQHADR